MKRELYRHFSHSLGEDMNILAFGHSGVPLVAFPCQNGKCNNWESFAMPQTIADYIDSGRIQLFCLDAVDEESWSDRQGGKEHRAWVQECYYRWAVEEALPWIADINGTGDLPIATGCSLGATHASIVFLRRPDLFAGMFGMSGVYDARFMWDGWSNSTLYDNSPVQFLENMPADHPYIALYNEKRIALCVGQGRWEDEGRRTAAILRDIFLRKGIHGWVDFWGYDVDHDWPWWKKQLRYFLPWLLGER